MKKQTIQELLNKAAQQFCTVKRVKATRLLEEVVYIMDPIGGITGLLAKQNCTITLHNHNDSYKLPIRMPEHTSNLSRQDKKNYEFLELMNKYLLDHGVSKRDIEYHMGKRYSSKHQRPNISYG